MRDRSGADARLVLFRSEWPTRITWREVREAEPRAFRSAVGGALLLVPAVLATLLVSAVSLEVPFAVPLPGWIDGIRGLLMVACFWGALMLWIWSWALLSQPSDTRRELAFRRFAAHRGLGFAPFGAMPERLGILFAEGEVAPARTRALRERRRRDPAGAPLYNARYALSDHASSPNPADPDLQLAIAGYTGGKNDPKGPRPAFRFLSLRLPRVLPHLMIDARRGGTLRALLPGVQRISLEGDFDRHFSVYAPNGYARDALELLTPDVMVCLIDHGRRWDIEVVEDRLIVASPRLHRRSDRAETTALLRFAELIGVELGHQAVHYTDPRSSRPRSQVADAGRRLRRRSAAWATAAFAVAVAAMLAFPHVLGWFLDAR
ncbi:DUF3137 domain-containing protein [Leucobacter allii]|uniref:DUF3137 domain-containing protein n=1 Tax=Leucobacter allii TaxID=2932247 RepID=UPI001FD56399|nr:DUF3137 domain-containing protein [Leucobacter allii]UOR03270.1 DUF3137 domain-containing protein [Leucobacter allii]